MTATSMISIFDRVALSFFNVLVLAGLPIVAAGLAIGSL
jgi:hypothetical protein